MRIRYEQFYCFLSANDAKIVLSDSEIRTEVVL